MNRRIVKKVLSNPRCYTMPMVRRAAARERLWWFDGSQTVYWSEMSKLPKGRAWRRYLRKVHRAHAGVHDWAFRKTDVPF